LLSKNHSKTSLISLKLWIKICKKNWKWRSRRRTWVKTRGTKSWTRIIESSSTVITSSSTIFDTATLFKATR
jgi:hypothetical protein